MINIRPIPGTPTNVGDLRSNTFVTFSDQVTFCAVCRLQEDIRSRYVAAATAGYRCVGNALKLGQREVHQPE